MALGVGLALLRELLRAPMMNFLQQRKLDETSQALKRSVFQEILKDRALAAPEQMSLCFVRLEGLRDYLDVLPLSTLQNSFRHITEILKEQLRGKDLVAKWDNLEYSVLLSNTAGKAAWNTMGRVKEALSDPMKLDVSGEELELKPVIGIAEYSPGDTDLSLIKKTSEALELARTNSGIYLGKMRELA
jgi:diguanylate cyclase (GGDEF)-like protein